MEKIKAAILGTGNIGTDLLIKVMRSEYISCSLFSGTNPNSKNIARANLLGIITSSDSIDATNADSHNRHAPILEALGKYTIDLTPSKVGELCIPALNMNECLDKNNINLVTCGGQASIPLAHVIRQIHPEVNYIEVVASIASKSAGPGTRLNIDEYIETTEDGIRKFCGLESAKAILNLNPAVPPIHMHNTIYAEISRKPNLPLIKTKVEEMAERIEAYVPGYRIILSPTYDEGVITMMLEVCGLGDHLPQYAGNLDIITCAAVMMAEEKAKKMMGTRGKSHG